MEQEKIALAASDTWPIGAAKITFKTLSIDLCRSVAHGALAHIHVIMVFLYGLGKLAAGTEVIKVLLELAPWTQLASFLTGLARLHDIDERTRGAALQSSPPCSEDGNVKPLPEDHLLRGIFWTPDYTEPGCSAVKVDDEARQVEDSTTASVRAERILWQGIRLSTVRRPYFLVNEITNNSKQLEYLDFDPSTKIFTSPCTNCYGTLDVNNMQHAKGSVAAPSTP